MVTKPVPVSRNRTRGDADELLDHQNIENPNFKSEKRARFLAKLNARYGYSNEKSVDEMTRILKDFFNTNKSLGIHHTRSTMHSPSTK